MNTPRCEHCREHLGARHAHNARYCSTRCRMAAHRARRTVPAELTARPRWVRHTRSKVPLTVTGSPASSTDPGTWSRHADAVRSTAGAGLGFVLNGDGVVCVDLDHCLDGEWLAPWAERVLSLCPPTFVEVSRSGTGLHIWGTAHVDRGRRVRLAGGGTAEVYGDGRYIAVTGRAYAGAPVRLGDLTAAVEYLIGE